MLDLLKNATTTLPESDTGSAVSAEPDWMVVVYNNETNTWEEVMVILMFATACDEQEAYIETWEIDHYGQCVVHRASSGECRQVAEVVATIGIRVEALPGE